MHVQMKFRKSLVAVGVLAVLASGQAMADLGSIGIYANTDNSGGEGVYITSNGNGSFNGAGAALFLTTDGYASLRGNTAFNITSPATTLSGTLSVTGTSTTTGITNTGTLSNTGAFTQAGGAANINVNSTQTTNIGTGAGASVNNIGGVNSTNTITGANNTMTAVNANTITGASNSITASTGDNSILASAGNNSIAADQNNYLTAGGDNNITAATGTNNIEAPINNIGVSTTSSVNTIGNSNAATSVTTRGGNATSVVANNVASLTVTGGTSSLPGHGSNTTTGKLMVSNTGGASVDANGKITADNSTAPSASLTLTNGLGNTHGIVVTESQTTMSGGTQSSSLTLNNRAATFSQSQSGAPITVTGVANGAADFDAVNVRQFAGAIAAVTAAANIPSPEAGKTTSVGLGLGSFMGKSALSMGVVHQMQKGPTLKFSVAGGLDEGGQTPTVGLGAGWSW